MKVPKLGRNLTKQEKIDRLDCMIIEVRTKLLPKIKDPEDKKKAVIEWNNRYTQLREKVMNEPDDKVMLK